MLDAKGIAYKRVDLMPVVSKGALRAWAFPAITVPALKIDGRASPGLARDRPGARPARARAAAASRRPDGRAGRRAGRALGRRGAPARRPADPVERAAARPLTARLLLGGRQAGHPDRARREDRRQPLVALSARLNEATDENVRADLAALPGMLQRIDDWIADGMLGGEQPTPPTCRSRPASALLMTLRGPAPARSPPGRRASSRCALVPDYPGDAAADPAAGVARAAAGSGAAA